MFINTVFVFPAKNKGFIYKNLKIINIIKYNNLLAESAYC